MFVYLDPMSFSQHSVSKFGVGWSVEPTGTIQLGLASRLA